jgi:hypothetical protein
LVQTVFLERAAGVAQRITVVMLEEEFGGEAWPR